MLYEYIVFIIVLNDPIVGRLCRRLEHKDATQERVNCAERKDYMDYLLERDPVCEVGTKGNLTWTPNSTTPRIVYYHVSCNSLCKALVGKQVSCYIFLVLRCSLTTQCDELAATLVHKKPII